MVAVKAVVAFVLVVYGTGAPWMEQHAAQEMAKYVEQMGYTVKAVDSARYETAAKDAQLVILLGSPETNPLIKKLVDSGSVDFAGIKHDGFIIKGITGKPATLVIGGRVARGTLNGAYDYLQRYSKCGFFQDGDYVPKNGKLPVEGVELQSTPRFLYRLRSKFGNGHVMLSKYTHHYWDLTEHKRNIDWWAKRKLNVSGEMVYPGIVGGFFEKTAEEVFDLAPAGTDEAWDWPPAYREEIVKGEIEYCRKLGFVIDYWTDFGAVPVRFMEQHPEYTYTGGRNQIDPSDPAGVEWTQKFMKRVIEKFGTDHFYSASVYGEQAPGKDPLQLKIDASAQMVKLLKRMDPETKLWRIDAWDFWINPGGIWTKENVKKYLDGLPKGLLYIADNTTDFLPDARFPDTLYNLYNYYEGHLWAFAVINSFADNDWLHGDLQDVLDKASEVINDRRGENCIGFHLMPENQGANPLYWQFMTELAWNPGGVTVAGFLRDYATQRYGQESADAMFEALVLQVEAMRLFPDFAYRTSYRQPGDTQTPQDRLLPKYERGAQLFHDALVVALREAPRQAGNRLYENDVMDIARMWLEFVATASLFRCQWAAEAGNEELARQLEAEVINALERVGDILSTRDDYSLVKDIERIMSVPGTNPNTPRQIRSSHISIGGYRVVDSLELIRCYHIPRVRSMVNQKLGQPSVLFKDIDEQWVEGKWAVPEESYFKGTPLDAIRAALDSMKAQEKE